MPEQQANNREVEVNTLQEECTTTVLASQQSQQLNGCVKVPAAITADLNTEQDGKVEVALNEEQKEEGHSLCKFPKGRGWFTQVRYIDKQI